MAHLSPSYSTAIYSIPPGAPTAKLFSVSISHSSSAAASHLRRLDPVQSKGLRLAIGAFRSTPIVSLHVEANIQPLSLCCRLINYKVFLRLRHTPDSPLSLFREGAVDAVTLWPFTQDARELLTSAGLADSTILNFSYDTGPLGLSRLPQYAHISIPCPSPRLCFSKSVAASSRIPSPSPAWYLYTLMGPSRRTGWGAQ